MNLRVDGTRKRKALKTRNGVGESAQFIDRAKIKQNGNGNTLKRAAIEWTLKEEFSRNKNEIKWNENFIIPQGSYGIWNGSGQESKLGGSTNLDQQMHDGGLSEILRRIKWDENFAISSLGNGMCNGNGNGEVEQEESIHRSQYAHNEGPSGSLRKINWNESFPTDQRNHNRPGGNNWIVRRKSETLSSQEQSGSNGKIITGEGSDDEEPSGSEIRWNSNVCSGQNTDDDDYDDDNDDDAESVDVDNEINWSRNDLNNTNNDRGANVIKSAMNGEESEQNDSILRDVEEPIGNGIKSERSGNVADESSSGDTLNENDPVMQNEVKKLDEKKSDQNRNGLKHQNGTEETSNSFPRKTKTLGLLCRKFVFNPLIALSFYANLFSGSFELVNQL